MCAVENDSVWINEDGSLRVKPVETHPVKQLARIRQKSGVGTLILMKKSEILKVFHPPLNMPEVDAYRIRVVAIKEVLKQSPLDCDVPPVCGCET